MRQEAHSGSSCSPWWRHSLVWEGTRPTHFPWNINAIMIIIVSEHFGNGACGITSHHVSSSAPSEGYERCPLLCTAIGCHHFRSPSPLPSLPTFQSPVRLALGVGGSTLQSERVSTPEPTKCRQWTEAASPASHCWNFLNATAWYCSLGKNYEDTVSYVFLIVYVFLIFSV